MLKIIFSSALLCLLITGHAEEELSATHENWPMAGGPQGNWQLQTNAELPLEWSVRQNKNIKWQTELPEGGQSGIAVWGKQLFLTILPPLDRPTFAALTANRDKRYEIYRALRHQIETQLKTNKSYLEQLAALKEAQDLWEDYRLNTIDKAKGKFSKHRLTIASQERKLHQKRTQELANYLDRTDSELKKAHLLFKKAAAELTQTPTSTDIILLCLNNDDGKIIWQKRVKGLRKIAYHRGFSDSSSPTPTTDGKHVWAINNSGGMACFDFAGKEIWSRTWMPGGRESKQYDSILLENCLISVEPASEGDSKRTPGWNYLHGIDKLTGQVLWISEDALSDASTPVIGRRKNGHLAIAIGRGGPHGMPERPIGLSLVSLEAEDIGKTIWRWEPEGEPVKINAGALSTHHWDKQRALWFVNPSRVERISLDTESGEKISQASLARSDVLKFNTTSQEYELTKNSSIPGVMMQAHNLIVSGDHLYVLKRFEPYIIRHNLNTGETIHLELPTEIDSHGHLLWRTQETTDVLNSQAQRHARDKRAFGDGFQKCFLGPATKINQFIYLTNPLGITFVIDSSRPTFDGKSIVAINDLGKRGETWTLASLSYANGRIYHRSLKSVVCIELKRPPAK